MILIIIVQYTCSSADHFSIVDYSSTEQLSPSYSMELPSHSTEFTPPGNMYNVYTCINYTLL